MAFDSNQTYSLAHTAQCKLKLAADRPDRNLRFVLGHAFTFDKVMYRIAEIEGVENSTKHKEPSERRVSFRDNSNLSTGDLRNESQLKSKRDGKRARSPPPDATLVEDSDTDSDDYVLDDYDDDSASLGLSKTVSHIAQPPPLNQPPPHLEDDGYESDDDDEDEPVSPPTVPLDSTLATLTEEEADETLTALYETVRKCECQKTVDEKAPEVNSIWELPQQAKKKPGLEKHQIAIVRVEG